MEGKHISVSLWLTSLPLIAVLLASIVAAAGTGYEPEHALGSGKDDWWTRYPDQNMNADQPVGHPLWVLNALKDGPVLILDRTQYCRPCVMLHADVKRIMANTSSVMTYYDLNAEGSDKRAHDVMEIYSPIGISEDKVPLIVFLTLILDESGQVKVAWHSNTGLPVDSQGNDLGEILVSSYLEDAIYYHRQNIDAALENPDLFSGVRESLRMERLKSSAG